MCVLCLRYLTLSLADDTDWTRWVGLIDDRPYNAVVGWNCGILVCLVVQRYAARWKLSDYGSDVSYSEIVLFPMTDPEILQSELKEHAEAPGRTAWVLMRERIKWYLSNLYTINGLAVRTPSVSPCNNPHPNAPHVTLTLCSSEVRFSSWCLL